MQIISKQKSFFKLAAPYVVRVSMSVLLQKIHPRSFPKGLWASVVLPDAFEKFLIENFILCFSSLCDAHSAYREPYLFVTHFNSLEVIEIQARASLG